MTEPAIFSSTGRFQPEGCKREDLVARVCAAVRGEIRERQLSSGTRLPSETDLAKSLGVSRPTLREATRVLAQEGLLDIRHGVGTFVAAGPRLVINPIDSMRSFTASIRAAGGEPRVQDLAVDEIAAPQAVALAMAIPPQSNIIRIKRVRLIDDRPLALSYEHIPLAPSLTLASFDAYDGSSLYDFLASKLSITLLRSEVRLTAVNATEFQAGLLAVELGAPLLLMREIHFGEADSRLLYSINYHNSSVIDLTLVRSGLRT